MINTGDTAWLLVSSALVMLMTPGLALFYGGMVRRKNLLSTIMMSMAILGIVSILWVLYGYSLAFGPDVGGFIGNLKFIGLSNVGQAPSTTYATTVPHLAFMIFQAMFAIITVALWTGAVVERMKFSSLVIVAILWFTLVYCPVAHWVWGSGGWLSRLGALDFAGGTVVHINAGVSALALAMLLGQRRGYKKDAMEPNNIPLIMIGAALLWFGWFGFNAGSALTAGGLASSAFVATNTVGCCCRCYLDGIRRISSASHSGWHGHGCGGRAGGDYAGGRIRTTISWHTNRYRSSNNIPLRHDREK